ncbi:LOW QUALITY PROTEIN: hypothetical protein PanWU01x14_228420 [Parasponia andersonii]|uniref:Uncharacterized protein n=1 Tax=Parasponia andersonii TaxID=3476 RepID=A0A2P5BLL5_PARAD|nr:LOW QUALITY PROTEIN: hypothetical protein PanWU01x14_228420 [Parasponia andersonii]
MTNLPPKRETVIHSRVCLTQFWLTITMTIKTPKRKKESIGRDISRQIKERNYGAKPRILLGANWSFANFPNKIIRIIFKFKFGLNKDFRKMRTKVKILRTKMKKHLKQGFKYKSESPLIEGHMSPHFLSFSLYYPEYFSLNSP